jgi:hypothetical protein
LRVISSCVFFYCKYSLFSSFYIFFHMLNYSMHLPLYTVHTHTFLISSLLSWFLRLVYVFQLSFFFFSIEFFFQQKYFLFFKKKKKIEFIIIHLLFILYYSLFVCFFQIFLVIFIFFLKKTTKSFFTPGNGKGMVLKSFNTIQLYLPVLFTTTQDNVTISLQFFVKILFLVVIAFFFNIIL